MADWGLNDPLAGAASTATPTAMSAEPAAPAVDWGLNDKAKADEGWLDYINGIAQKVASGVTMGFEDEIAAGMGSLFGLGHRVGLKDYDEILKEVRAEGDQFRQLHPYVSTAAEVTGAVPTMVGGAGLVKGVPMLGKTLGMIEKVPGWLTRSSLRGAAAGAPYGALHEVGTARDISTPGEYAEKALEGGKEGAMYGALFSPAFEGAGRAIGSVVGPWASKEARALLDKDVPLTMGETIGGPVKWFEDVASRLPLAGHTVRAAQERSTMGFNKAAINEALAPLGKKITGEGGHDAIVEAADTIAKSYEKTLARMNGSVDKPLLDAIGTIRGKLPQVKWPEFDDALRRNLFSIADQRTGDLSRNAFKQVEASLNKEAADLVKSMASTPYDKQLGRHLFDVREAVLKMAERHNPAELVKGLRDTNKAYKRLRTVERAASGVGAKEGVFTPAQLHRAVKAKSPERAFAQGRADMQDFSGAAKRSMTGTVPNSGTPERMMMAALLHGVPYAGGFGFPGMGAEIGIGALYTKAGQDMMRKLAAGAPESREYLAQILRDAGLIYGSPAGAAYGSISE